MKQNNLFPLTETQKEIIAELKKDWEKKDQRQLEIKEEHKKRIGIESRTVGIKPVKPGKMKKISRQKSLL